MEHDLKIFTDNIEPEALSQIYALLAQPAFSGAKVRIMPDVHAGAGCVIGFTADLGDKVIPNVVGVDLGCGMRVVEFGKVNIDLAALDAFIHENIPAGFEVNDKPQVPAKVLSLLMPLHCLSQLSGLDRIRCGVGSLGGGNHFIEIDEDEEGNKYLVIHTGSRNLGKQVAEIYQNMAIKHCREEVKPLIESKISELKAAGRQSEIPAAIAKIYADHKDMSVPKDLCFLEGDGRERYLHDMRICQKYAVLNREVIASKITSFLGLKPIAEWESVHNYIDDSNMVRKGAIAAHKGQKVIIPLNMRDGSIIGIGLGNPEWNESGPHGAGRIMSRSQAKASVSMDDFRDSMKDIYTTTVSESTIDEAPMVYKNPTEIIEAIGDTVRIAKIIKPVYNFKASEDGTPPWRKGD